MVITLFIDSDVQPLHWTCSWTCGDPMGAMKQMIIFNEQKSWWKNHKNQRHVYNVVWMHANGHVGSTLSDNVQVVRDDIISIRACFCAHPEALQSWPVLWFWIMQTSTCHTLQRLESAAGRWGAHNYQLGARSTCTDLWSGARYAAKSACIHPNVRHSIKQLSETELWL